MKILLAALLLSTAMLTPAFAEDAEMQVEIITPDVVVPETVESTDTDTYVEPQQIDVPARIEADDRAGQHINDPLPAEVKTATTTETTPSEPTIFDQVTNQINQQEIDNNVGQ